jgi:hypothetical protein
MKNHSFLGKLKTINVLRRNERFNLPAKTKNGELFSQTTKSQPWPLTDAPDQAFLSSCQRNYLTALRLSLFVIDKKKTEIFFNLFTLKKFFL